MWRPQAAGAALTGVRVVMHGAFRQVDEGDPTRGWNNDGESFLTNGTSIGGFYVCRTGHFQSGKEFSRGTTGRKAKDVFNLTSGVLSFYA